MNEKFGFLSRFGGVKVNDVKKNEAPINTPRADNTLQRNLLLTDDESDSEYENVRSKKPPERRETRIFERKTTNKPMINRILESSSSSLLNVPDQSTDEDAPITKRNPSSETLFNSNDLISQNSNQSKAKPSDTVVGSFSDEELCSQLDEMKVKDQTPKKQPTNESLKETVVGAFSDLSLSDRLVEIQKRNQLRDTVIQSSSDDSDDEGIPPPPRPLLRRPKAYKQKESLPDTVIGFSESMSSLSIRKRSSAVPQEICLAEEEVFESSDEAEVITIPDSDEEVSSLNDDDEPPVLSSTNSFRNCSSINSAKTDRESDSTLNRFFNNPPSIGSSQAVVTHSVIRKHKDSPIVKVSKESQVDVSRDRFNFEDGLVENDQDNVELSETNVSTEKSQTLANDSKSSEEKSQQPIPSSSETSSDNQTLTQSVVNANISFSANINISVKISMQDSTSSSGSSSSSAYEPSSSESEDSQPQQHIFRKTRKQDARHDEKTSVKIVTSAKKTENRNVSSKAVNSGRKEKLASTPESNGIKPLLLINSKNPNDFKTPVKEDAGIIDEDLQAILDSVYGDTWKTPQLLRSCKSKNVRQDLRKSIAANNFEAFVKNLPQDLESTRINRDELPKKIVQSEPVKKKEFLTPNPSKLNEFKKPTSSVKKTPRYEKPKRARQTPKYLDICDSDTPSSDDENSDNEFKANDTWNASSDDDAEEEVRIRRRTIAREKGEEIVFVPDQTIEDRRKKLEELLERSEFKKPPVLGGTLFPKISKKKLFSQTEYDDDSDLENKQEEKKENDFVKEPDDDAFLQNPFLLPKKTPEPTVQKIRTPAKKTPRKALTPKTAAPSNIFNKTFSFLKSLDTSTDAIYCNSEALHYRKYYKSKKVELANKLFKLFNEKVFERKLAEVSIKWNKKLLNTAGRCNNSRTGGVRKSFLELSDKVLTSADRLRCTLIHEMCHAATWIFHGENGHGATWKRWAAKANAEFPELPTIKVCHSYIIEYRYTYQCVNCKAKYQTHSKSKKVENIRCSICKSAIELFLNKKDKDGKIVLTPVTKNVKGFPKFVQLKYKDVKQPNMTHKEVMQVLSQQFACLTTQEKQDL